MGAFAAKANELQAVRPGVICSSTGALAKLTRPDGSSRASVDEGNPIYQAIKSAGHCSDLQMGEIVSVIEGYHNTSKVSLAATPGVFFIANIDFAAVRDAFGPASPRIEAARPSPPLAAPSPGAVSAGFDAQRPSVMGLSLGMSPAEARAKLDVSLTIRDRSFGDPARTGIAAYTEHGRIDGTDPYEAYALEFVHDRLAYILHVQIFAPTAEPPASSVAAALTQQYGKRSWWSAQDPAGDWNLDSAGRPIVPSQSVFCAYPQELLELRGNIDEQNTHHVDAAPVPKGGPAPAPAFDVHTVCGRSLTADSTLDRQNRSLVKKLAVVLSDPAPFFRLDAERKDLPGASQSLQTQGQH